MRKLVIGLSMPLSGEYAASGRQIEAAMRLFAAETNDGGGIDIDGVRREIALEYRDDASKRDRAAAIYRWLCFERRVDLLLGPYSSGLTRAAAEVAKDARMLLVNHGGADDHLLADRGGMIVGVLTPASEYMKGFVRLLATLKLWRKRVAIVAPKTPFAQAVAAGAESECATRRAWLHGVRLRLKYAAGGIRGPVPEDFLHALRRNRINALISAGSYDHDLATMRLAIESRHDIPVLGCVAAGVARFGADLGNAADGIVGPSQWEEDAEINPAIGLRAREFVRRMNQLDRGAGCDYPAAQAYAAGLLAVAALRAAGQIDQERLRAAFAALRTTTLFGDFAIEPDSGCQVGHRMLLVQWHRGRKVIIEPEPRLDAGELEFPSGWRLIVASLRSLRLSRPDHSDEADGSQADHDKER